MPSAASRRPCHAGARQFQYICNAAAVRDVMAGPIALPKETALSTTPSLLQVAGLRIAFAADQGAVEVVHGLDLAVASGENSLSSASRGSASRRPRWRSRASSTTPAAASPPAGSASSIVPAANVTLYKNRRRKCAGCAVRTSRWCSRNR